MPRCRTPAIGAAHVRAPSSCGASAGIGAPPSDDITTGTTGATRLLRLLRPIQLLRLLRRGESSRVDLDADLDAQLSRCDVKELARRLSRRARSLATSPTMIWALTARTRARARKRIHGSPTRFGVACLVAGRHEKRWPYCRCSHLRSRTAMTRRAAMHTSVATGKAMQSAPQPRGAAARRRTAARVRPVMKMQHVKKSGVLHGTGARWRRGAQSQPAASEEGQGSRVRSSARYGHNRLLGKGKKGGGAAGGSVPAERAPCAGDDLTTSAERVRCLSAR